MNLPRYTEYKKCKIEWLGDLPSHWEVKRLKTISPSITVGIVVNPSNYVSEDGLPFIYGGDISEGKISVDSCRKISPQDSHNQAKTMLEAGDLLTVRVGAPGVTAVVPASCAGGNCASVMLVRKGQFDSAWLCYVMNSRMVRNQVEVVQYGAAQEQFNIGHAINFWIATPPHSEQVEIAAFLDRETRKIDALIADQEKLLALLEEKRQATISHAVTRGLDPDVPLKDSGAAWLGDVPAHWQVVPLAYRYNVQLGKMLDSAKITGDHLRPYLRVFDVQWGDINTDELPVMDFDEDARKKFRLAAGDILVNEGGSYPGRSAIWSDALDECYYQKALHRLRPYSAETDTPEFFYYVLFWAAHHGVFSYGGNETTIEHLPAERLRRYRFAFPPIEEQSRIATFLNVEIAKLDALTTEAGRAIHLLRERRSALISAAVTGKIDVRNAVPQELAA
jgi:type I restriction enzyme, S subunit